MVYDLAKDSSTLVLVDAEGLGVVLRLPGQEELSGARRRLAGAARARGAIEADLVGGIEALVDALNREQHDAWLAQAVASGTADSAS